MLKDRKEENSVVKAWGTDSKGKEYEERFKLWFLDYCKDGEDFLEEKVD